MRTITKTTPSARHRSILLFLTVLLALFSAPLHAGETTSTGLLGKGTDWQTRWYSTDSGEEGPLVAITGGIHGNEPAGARAAEQLRHWPIVTGRVVVIPRCNQLALEADSRYTPGAPRSEKNLNRNFPRGGEENKAISPQGKAIWKFISDLDPDWLIDLHEGYDINRQNPNSVGSSILTLANDETRPLFDHALAAVNASIDDSGKQLVMHDDSEIVDGSLARAARERLGAVSAILETTYRKIPLGVRVRQHRLMVNRLLRDLGVVEVGPDELVFPDNQDAIAVAVYEGPGVGGPGPAKIHEKLAGNEKFLVRYIDPGLIRNHRLDQFDAVIFPGGSGSAQARGLREEGRAVVREYVEDGGSFVGVCAGCYLACENFSWSLKILDMRTKSSKWRRGRSELEIAFTEAGQEMLDRESKSATVLYHNGPVMEPAESPEIPDSSIIATFKTEVAKNETPKGIQVDSPAIMIGEYGDGRVAGISPHPEQTDELARLIPRLLEKIATREENGTGELVGE